MKKLGAFLIPVVLFLVMTTLGNRMAAEGKVNISFIGILAIVFLVMLLLTRKKIGPGKSTEAVMAEFLDEYAANAFADDEALKAKFYAALTDFGKNMPKAALSKLEKLEPLCTGKKEQYAVAMALAKTNFQLQKFPRAIREYNKAVVINPTCAVASAIGDCYQRMGELKKAQDSYEFAIELDPKNPDPCSRLATTYVADWDYTTALYYAEHALTLDENYASALATSAICYSMQDNVLMAKHYTDRAVANGYSAKKIEDTVSALKKCAK